MSLEERALREIGSYECASCPPHHEIAAEFAAPYEAALRELMKALPSELHCHELHHPKKDRHGLTADCPVEERYKQALSNAERLLNGGGDA